MQTVFGFIVTIDIKGLFVVRLTSQGRNRATSEYRNPVKQQKQNTSRTHDKELRFPEIDSLESVAVLPMKGK